MICQPLRLVFSEEIFFNSSHYLSDQHVPYKHSMNNNYEIHLDESGLYVARNSVSPGVFVEATTENELSNQITLAETDLKNIRSDRPAIRTRLDDLTRQLLGDYGFVNRGMGKGDYEVWARGNAFLTVPAPIRAKKTPSRIVGYAFLIWRRENGIK